VPFFFYKGAHFSLIVNSLLKREREKEREREREREKCVSLSELSTRAFVDF